MDDEFKHGEEVVGPDEIVVEDAGVGLVIEEGFGPNGWIAGKDGFAGELLEAAVKAGEEDFAEVEAGAEKLAGFLAFLRFDHGGDAAADGGVVTVELLADEAVVFELDGGGVDGDFGDVFFPSFREVVVPEDGEVGLGGGAEVFDGLDEAVGGFGDEGLAFFAVLVGEHAAEGESGPDGVAGVHFVEIGVAEEANDAKFDDEIVDYFLDPSFGDYFGLEVAFGVNVEEGIDAADAHGGAVLLFAGGEVGEVEPVDGFLEVGGGTGKVVAVF